MVVDNAKRPEYQNLTNVYWFVAEMCKTVGNKTPMQEYVKKLRPGQNNQKSLINQALPFEKWYDRCKEKRLFH